MLLARESILVAAIAIATLATILAERAGSQRGIWLAKPLASAGFVALGLARGLPSFSDTFHAGLLVALLLCFLGDVLLIPRHASVFRAAILAFLLAHVAFIVALYARGGQIETGLQPMLLALAPLAVAAALVGRWILPRASRALRGAVVAYIVVITIMVAVAASNAEWWLPLAALAFWANDILVARDRFVQRSWLNRAFGLPLYYGAMTVFALAASGSL